jgi:hypothetical protein
MAKKELFNGNIATIIPLESRLAHGVPGITQVGAGNILVSDFIRQFRIPVIVRETLNNEEKIITIPYNSYVIAIDFETVEGVGTIEAAYTSGAADIVENSDPNFKDIIAKYPTGGNLFVKAIGFECKVNVAYLLNYF